MLGIVAHTVSGKVMVIVPPIAAFVAIGFAHSAANMYVIPLAMFSGVTPLRSGGVFVAAAYWAVYLRAK